MCALKQALEAQRRQGLLAAIFPQGDAATALLAAAAKEHGEGSAEGEAAVLAHAAQNRADAEAAAAAAAAGSAAPAGGAASLLDSLKSGAGPLEVQAQVQAHVAAAVEAAEGASAKELSRVVAVKDAEHAVATAAAVVRTRSRALGLPLAKP